MDFKQALIDEGLSEELQQLVLKHIVIKEEKIKVYSSPFSSYKYREEQLEDADHIHQLVKDILLANLDKVNYKSNKRYSLVVGDVYWYVSLSQEIIPQRVKVEKISLYVELEDIPLITEQVIFNKIDSKSSNSRFCFINSTQSYQKDDFVFNTREEAVSFFKCKFDLN